MPRWLAGILTVAALTACGAGDGAAARVSGTVPSRSVTTPTSVSDRCQVPVEGGELVEVVGPAGSVMTGAVMGGADTVAVYLHQTSPAGFCGWTVYAAWAARRGVGAVLVDLCGWGRSRCKGAFASDPAALAAPRTTVPLLVAIASGDRAMQPADVRAAFDTSPATVKKFVSPPSGHGWGMLNDGTDADPVWTPLAQTVLAWVKGDYAAA
ncbi:MAG: hypothetical protein WB473_04660 [Pedococcus sp.]